MSTDAPDVRVIEELVAHIFPRSFRPQVERVEEGVSTFVYRLRCADAVSYLRVSPEADTSFAPEVYAHQCLRELGVQVPEVIAFEHGNAALGRSVMVTMEIKGASLAHCADEQAQHHILRAAGRDLAVINSLPVQGFGWIKRDRARVTHLEAEQPTSRTFLCEYLEHDLATLAKAQALKPDMLDAIHSILKHHDAWLDSEHSWLAHGDFDVTHIYQEAGRYTGIIDFGEIRGADRWYDLGHFSMHDGEQLPAPVLPSLLEGYQDMTLLPDGYTQRIALVSLLIAIRTLGRTWQKRPQTIDRQHGLQSISRDIQCLLI